MMFKAMAATLAVLPMLADAIPARGDAMVSHALPTTQSTEQRMACADTAGAALLPVVCRDLPCAPHRQAGSCGAVIFDQPIIENPTRAVHLAVGTHVPEPRTLAWLGLGLLLFGMHRRSRTGSKRTASEDRNRELPDR